MRHRQDRRELHGYQPTAESRAMAEHAATTRLAAYLGEPTTDARTFADLFLLGAESHFDGLCGLVEHERGLLCSDKALARAGIEACARAAWLLDPSVDAQRRAERGLTQRFANISENVALLKGARDAEHHVEALRARRDDIAAACRRAGLTATPKKGSFYVREEVPSERSAMRHLLSVTGDTDLGSFTQTWLSRFVHTDPAGLMELFADDLPEDLEVPVVAGMVTKGLEINSDSVNLLMAMCATTYVIAAGLYLRHVGWDDPDWKKVTVNLRGFVHPATGRNELNENSSR